MGQHRRQKLPITFPTLLDIATVFVDFLHFKATLNPSPP